MTKSVEMFPFVSVLDVVFGRFGESFGGSPFGASAKVAVVDGQAAAPFDQQRGLERFARIVPVDADIAQREIADVAGDDRRNGFGSSR